MMSGEKCVDFSHSRISDDLCVIYAALATGPQCYYVSNDHMSDYVSRLSAEHARLFRNWQASRQITVSRRIRLLVGCASAVVSVALEFLPPSLQYPADHSQLVQWTDCGWHVPVRDSSLPGSPDDWLHEGKRVDYSGSLQLDNVEQWLCIRPS